MDLQTFLNSRRAGKLAFWLSRMLPPQLGVSLAQRIARSVAARRGLPLVQALRINQWVAAGGRLNEAELDRAVQECLEQVGLAFYHLFRNSENAAALDRLVVFDSRIEELIARSQEHRRGLVVAGLHMSGFDIVLQACARRGFRALALSLPNETRTVAWQHEFRRRSGLEILPATLPNLRLALQRLMEGGTVLTGIDRPTPELKYRPRFFGRPAPLPTHHIYLAQKAETPVLVMNTYFNGCQFQILASEELQMESGPNRSEEMIRNAENVLQAAQTLICRAPHQWVVPLPVWPDASSEIPGRR